jgi:hypothetical protein
MLFFSVEPQRRMKTLGTKREYVVTVDERLTGSSLETLRIALGNAKSLGHVRAFEVAELPPQQPVVVASEGELPA